MSWHLDLGTCKSVGTLPNNAIARLFVSVSVLYVLTPRCHFRKRTATLDMNICMEDGILSEASAHTNSLTAFEFGS